MNKLKKTVTEQLWEKAENILNENYFSNKLSDNDIKKCQLIIALCLKYNLKYQFVNDCVFIYSIIDEWYFHYTNENISLFHKNKLHTTQQYHFQKKFRNIVHIIQYIKKHDNFCYKPNNKFLKLEVKK